MAPLAVVSAAGNAISNRASVKNSARPVAHSTQRLFAGKVWEKLNESASWQPAGQSRGTLQNSGATLGSLAEPPIRQARSRRGQRRMLGCGSLRKSQTVRLLVQKKRRTGFSCPASIIH